MVLFNYMCVVVISSSCVVGYFHDISIVGGYFLFKGNSRISLNPLSSWHHHEHLFYDVTFHYYLVICLLIELDFFHIRSLPL